MLSATIPHRSDELAELAWARVGPLISLETREEAYVEAIHRGELQLDLLFPEDATKAAYFARHPAILWKLENVRSYRLRSSRKANTARPRTDSNKD